MRVEIWGCGWRYGDGWVWGECVCACVGERLSIIRRLNICSFRSCAYRIPNGANLVIELGVNSGTIFSFYVWRELLRVSEQTISGNKCPRWVSQRRRVPDPNKTFSILHNNRRDGALLDIFFFTQSALFPRLPFERHCKRRSFKISFLKTRSPVDQIQFYKSYPTARSRPDTNFNYGAQQLRDERF